MDNISSKRLKVLIIDDSAFSRQTIRRMLEKVPGMEVVGVAFDGQDGMDKLLKLKPDAVTLDLEMPRIDGFTLLRWIMSEMPMPVIIVSALGGDSNVFRALQLGAADFVIKPTIRASKELDTIEEDLIRKFSNINLFSIDKLKKNISLLDQEWEPEDVSFHKGGRIELVTIGASTGGPTAIQTILSHLPANFPGAILISQHMPHGFTRYFAERMDKVSAVSVREARDGEPVRKGEVLICPGGNHLFLRKSRDRVSIRIQKSLTNDRYVPSIDTMMKSAAEIYRERTMGIILTGMGKDGTVGMREIKERNGITIAESEESTIVYGMASEVISAGAADKVMPLKKIPREIMKNIKIN